VNRAFRLGIQWYCIELEKSKNAADKKLAKKYKTFDFDLAEDFMVTYVKWAKSLHNQIFYNCRYRMLMNSSKDESVRAKKNKKLQKHEWGRMVANYENCMAMIDEGFLEERLSKTEVEKRKTEIDSNHQLRQDWLKGTGELKQDPFAVFMLRAELDLHN
jgi:hypothetical protein